MYMHENWRKRNGKKERERGKEVWRKGELYAIGQSTNFLIEPPRPGWKPRHQRTSLNKIQSFNIKLQLRKILTRPFCLSEVIALTSLSFHFKNRQFSFAIVIFQVLDRNSFRTNSNHSEICIESNPNHVSNAQSVINTFSYI